MAHALHRQHSYTHTIELFRFKNHNFLELQAYIVPIKRMHMFCIENSLKLWIIRSFGRLLA